ncbi:MAG: glycosyltransferase [Lentimicrobium sp.]|jgi:predicted glycosyltransferase|nr:glycosyltransferase [Lentimicrobium sp.]
MKKLSVMVCPLDWGLGHATRCIPIIRYLVETGANVLIASDGQQLELLHNEFPDLEYITLPGYAIKFSRLIPVTMKIMLDTPRLLLKIRKEKKILGKLIRKYSIDIVISDNRYGLWNKNIYSIIITHQLNIIPPDWLSPFRPILHKLTHHQIEQFDECWVPDAEGDLNLSGKLSHGEKLPKNVRYIGLLSRFNHSGSTDASDYPYKVIALVSGPEPQRSVFEKILREQLPTIGEPCLLIRGLPANANIHKEGPLLDLTDHLTAGKLEHILHSRPLVICRAGYSTLMDIAFTGNKAILVPTPGQTEQEYLAKKLSGEGIYFAAAQNKLNLKSDYHTAIVGIKPVEKQNETSYKSAVDAIIGRLSQ